MNNLKYSGYITALLVFYLSTTEFMTTGKRIRGKFDRFGRRGLASHGPFRHPDSSSYYFHEDVSLFCC